MAKDLFSKRLSDDVGQLGGEDLAADSRREHDDSRWVDYHSQLFRTKGIDGSARERGQSEELDRIRTRGSWAGAVAAGLKLRPTELLIFGNARGGTPLMEADQRIGIDLPLKALVYQDDAGKVWLAYNDPSWLVRRYGLVAAVAANVEALSKVLGSFAAGAASGT